MHAEIPLEVREICQRLRGAGHEAWLVGGCVRDRLLGRIPKDWDVTTSALPAAVEALFPKTLAIGKAFGIITVVPDSGKPVEVATFRAEEGYADGRHPDGIRFTTAQEDVARRDFTINALLMNPETGDVTDFTGGLEDLRQRRLRAIGNPERRFREDHLRMLRAVRFASTLEFDVEEGTWAAIRKLAPLIRDISVERVRDECFRLLTESPHAGAALERLRESGLLHEIWPEVEAMYGVEQPPEFHPEGDVFTHTRLMLDGLPPHPSLRLALAVALHDVGKPPTAEYAPRADGTFRWRFECHAAVGADLARTMLTRLKAPTALTEEVVYLIRGHMRLAEAPRMRKAKLRQLLGSPLFADELELHRLDCSSSHHLLDVYEFLKAAKAAYAAEPVLPPPLVRGRDLIALGFKPGPAFAGILRGLYDLQLEGETDKVRLLAQVEPPTEE